MVYPKNNEIVNQNLSNEHDEIVTPCEVLQRNPPTSANVSNVQPFGQQNGDGTYYINNITNNIIVDKNSKKDG